MTKWTKRNDSEVWWAEESKTQQQQTTNQPFLFFENEEKRVDLIDCSVLPKGMNEWN